jgi:hypothetical protein
MKDEDIYRYRIMKSHSILVEFDGVPNRTNVPAPLNDRETWKQWTQRVLGNNISNVKILAPMTPEPATQMRTLREYASAEMVSHMFAAMRHDTKITQQTAVQGAVAVTARKLSTYSKASLRDILDEMDDALEPSVRQFFDHFLDSTNEDIEFDDLLRKLITTYNLAVHAARHMRNT